MNEIILISSLLILFAGVVLVYKFFGKAGIFAATAIITIMANIEVLLLVKAFGLEQTLGNVLFASTFLMTDILSEMEGKKEANRAVHLGMLAAVSKSSLLLLCIALCTSAKVSAGSLSFITLSLKTFVPKNSVTLAIN